MALWLYRRRNRVSPSSRPPPGFSIDEAETPPHEAGQERVGVGGWTWWKKTIGKKSGQDQGSRSDPGKIDAWHYPFEYTPVSANSSPGAGAYPPGQTQYVTANGHAHGPGYYDPYVGASTSRVTLPAPSGDDSDYELRRRERRERRERRRGRNSSETNLLAGRVSADGGLGAELRGQASHATLRYSPTPGASPGHHPGQPPYGVPPGYSSSHLQAGPGHSRSHSGTPTPGLFGTITPYVPPTTPTSHTSRPGGHSPIPPSGHSPVPPSGHSPHPSGHSPLPTGHSPTPPSTAPNPQYPQSPRAHTHTHTFEVQLSPGQYAELRSRYPDIRVRTRRHRRRDRDRDRDRARSGDEGDEEDGERRGRPRSWSVPAPGPALPAAGPPSPEEDQDQLDDGRPRNGPELAEKYRRRRRRRGTDAEAAVEAGAGVAGKSSEVDVVRPRETRERRGRERALDGGISLMGGPPRVR
ncbi:hypothetical protein FRC08_009732 [Ceratobasidium sp. 394]|nr:hypothetical protein FRC08_009732 [Ceratobasidium sp. 394]